MRCEERRAERAASPRSPSSTSVEQLEVGEDRGQRRAQLVRGVGDELALAVQRALGLVARGLEAVEHGLQRAGELGDLVVGRGLGQRLDGVAGALDVVRGGRERGDRGHRAAAEQDARRGATSSVPPRTPRAEEEPDAPDGGLDVGDLARVLDDRAGRDQPLGVA